MGDHISVSGLQGKRGWTEKLIRDFLGEPDQYAKNPNYASAAPMKLYSLKRVKRVERTKRFKEQFELAQKRRERARAASVKGVATKKENARRYAESIVIELERMPRHVLLKEAIASYNDHLMATRRDTTMCQFASKHSSPDFLTRIQRNYLRHMCSNYEYELDELFGKAGGGEAYSIIRDRVEEAIDEMYPYLIEEE